MIVIDVAAQNNSQILRDDESFPDPEATNRCVDTRDIKCTERERERERRREEERKKEEEKRKKKEEEETRVKMGAEERVDETWWWLGRSGAKRLPEREKGGKSAWSRAFIAYGSAKHLWNNGGRPSTSLAKKNESI